LCLSLPNSRFRQYKTVSDASFSGNESHQGSGRLDLVSRLVDEDAHMLNLVTVFRNPDRPQQTPGGAQLSCLHSVWPSLMVNGFDMKSSAPASSASTSSRSES
jgi:hypothetical protein